MGCTKSDKKLDIIKFKVKLMIISDDVQWSSQPTVTHNFTSSNLGAVTFAIQPISTSPHFCSHGNGNKLMSLR